MADSVPDACIARAAASGWPAGRYTGPAMKLGTRVTVVTTRAGRAGARRVRLRGAQGAARRIWRPISAARRARSPTALRAGLEPLRRRRRAQHDAARPACLRRARARRAVPAGGAARRRPTADRRPGVAAADAGRRDPGRRRSGRLLRLGVGRALRSPWRCRSTTPPGWSCRAATRRASPMAMLGMRRDAGYIDAEVAATARRIFPLFLWSSSVVALGVGFALRQTVVRAAAPPARGHRRRRQGRPVARHPRRARRRDRHDRRPVQRHDRLAARGARGRRARRAGAPGAGGAAAPVGEAGDDRPDGRRDRARGRARR